MRGWKKRKRQHSNRTFCPHESRKYEVICYIKVNMDSHTYANLFTKEWPGMISAT
jgi:hypothetical protein